MSLLTWTPDGGEEGGREGIGWEKENDKEKEMGELTVLPGGGVGLHEQRKAEEDEAHAVVDGRVAHRHVGAAAPARSLAWSVRRVE